MESFVEDYVYGLTGSKSEKNYGLDISILFEQSFRVRNVVRNMGRMARFSKSVGYGQYDTHFVSDEHICSFFDAYISYHVLHPSAPCPLRDLPLPIETFQSDIGVHGDKNVL